MDNTKFFNFKFVNRKLEQEKLKSFYNHELSSNVMWLSGPSGVGKSYLIEHTLKQVSNQKIIRLDLSSADQNINCLKQLLSLLQDSTKLSFKDFIKNNYTSVLDITKNVISILFKTKGIDVDIDGLLNFVFDKTAAFVENEKQKHQSGFIVIQNYINHILSEGNMIIYIDNFTNCDSKSLEIISELLGSYIGNSGICFLLTTTNEKFNERTDISKILIEKIKLEHLKINPFSNQEYFNEILLHIFDLNHTDDEDLSALFSACEGSPEKLRSTLRNLYYHDGITGSVEKNNARIVADKFKEIISKKTTFLDVDKLSEVEKMILRGILGFGKIINTNVLEEITRFLNEKLFKMSEITHIDFLMSLEKLSNTKIINISIENNVKKVRIEHDLIYRTLIMRLESPIYQPLVNFYLYNFLEMNVVFLKENNLSNDDISYLIAWHAFRGEVSNWEEINLKYGLSRFQNNQFNDAILIFDRLKAHFRNFTNENLLEIATCYYENGKYADAKDIFNFIDAESLETKLRYNYYYFYGKTENMLMNKQVAINYFQQALNNAEGEQEKEIMSLNMKQLALLETPNGREGALKIFNDIALNLTEERMQSRATGYLLRTCINFYSGNKAIDFLEAAEKIAELNQDSVEKAFIQNNKGFEWFKQNKSTEACDAFNNSIELLSPIKIHEISYPLNNLAVCSMVKGKYAEAIKYLNKAKFWNNSKYAELTIKTHLAVCYSQEKEYEKAGTEIDKLYEIIKSGNVIDSTIIRKICINLAIINKQLGKIDLAKECIEMGYAYAQNTSTAYRANQLIKELSPHFAGINTTSETGGTYCLEAIFEPWFITFTHD
ncbi:hypothetical protein BBD42_28475 [Paenibacillus sp. BIHB 4019]|uniref:Uncharacterized protein n=1 Tax=Paenibacillus sp. BIHB 4019 TaxID=1870819 RepID=A0A1B2DQM1_9BACL|nr:AAA family ATPase [Paenibacillus sp. BIHB 4019]ANY69998.1 hypothetical protein BBD42_28475 [Paenibacillus sp. BIHB 4019]